MQVYKSNSFIHSLQPYEQAPWEHTCTLTNAQMPQTQRNFVGVTQLEVLTSRVKGTQVPLSDLGSLADVAQVDKVRRCRTALAQRHAAQCLSAASWTVPVCRHESLGACGRGRGDRTS